MKSNKLLGAILLIAGTCVGAGMLALPVSTAPYGFYPASILFFICWLYMAYNAAVIMEVTLWTKPGSNLITMAKETLGRPGKIVAWVSYLFLLYALMTAYLSGSSALVREVISQVLHVHTERWVSAMIMIGFFAVIVYLGAKMIDYINRLLIIGLVIAYAALAIMITPHVNMKLLEVSTFHHEWAALPILVTAFGYHIIIPSLRSYLDSDTRKLHTAIVIGSLIPLILYVIWEFLIVGVVPKTGEHGLLAMLANGQPAADLAVALKAILGNSYVTTATMFFVFFAITTSFIGVSYSLFDFLADGFQVKKTRLSRIAIAALTFLPPLMFSLVYRRAFIGALSFAGIFVAILLSMLPAAMVWSGRYYKGMAKGYRAPGGRLFLLIAFLFSIGVIVAELIAR